MKGIDDCRVCGKKAFLAGEKTGRFRPRPFRVYHCPSCRFSFVGDPEADLGALYDEAYYRGQGADPLVRYLDELERPETSVRRYEWAGLLRIARALTGRASGLRWLDYGCGAGGLVRAARAAGHDAAGWETGWIRARAAEKGVPMLEESELEAARGSFDLVTAVEVVEHLPDPVSELARMAALLRPGGVLFCTTQNARPRRSDLLAWSYLVPEVHVSFFEPDTLALAFEKAGLRAERPGRLDGLEDVLRFKILKNLRVAEAGGLERLLPWGPLTRLVDLLYRFQDMPVGRKK